MTTRYSSGALLAWSLLALAIGCERMGCGGDHHLAELVSAQGAVQRDFASAVEQWKPAGKRELFAVGDGLRTGPGAKAKLRLRPAGEVVVDSDTLLRFEATTPGAKGARVNVDIGSIEVAASSTELTLDTVVGLLRVERDSRVRVRANDGAERLEVMLGHLWIDRDGKRVEASAGQELLLDVGGITLARATREPPAVREPEPAHVADVDAAIPQTPDAGAAITTTEDEEALPSAPLRADLTIAPGESAVIHDPSPPTRVRMPFAGCTQGGVLEVARGSSSSFTKVRGRDAGVVRLKPGRYRYRTRCLPHVNGGKPIAEGSMRVERDSGRRQLPRSAPAVVVEADGRRYTVRFQNRIPEITLRWPDAPAGERYALELTLQGGGTKKQSLTRPSQRFASGALPEGTHSFRFSTGDGAHTAEGSVRVDFDNAATTAYLSAPADGSIAAGRATTVSGAALSRSSVRIGATEVPMDAQGRFSTDVALEPGFDAIAVRVQHPQTGVHYYLRRAAGAPRAR